MFKHFHASILSLSYPRPASWSFSIFLYLLESLIFINLQFSCNKFGSSPIFLQHIRYKITIQFKYQPDSFEICNISDTSIKHDQKHWNPIISIMSINQHVTSSIQVYQECTYPFSHCPFLWMSSIPAHQVPTVLQVLIQVTQHKDDTNPSCLSSVLFRVLVIILHSSHPTQGWYHVPLLAVSP